MAWVALNRRGERTWAVSERIRVGVVGASVSGGGNSWGERAHIQALNMLPDFELKAVCTSKEETARASAEAFGAELAFHNVSEMVAHPDIDLIVVSVRVPSHREPVLAALKAGKATFCEWPLGADLREAEEMSREARQRRLPTMVGLQARSDPAVRYARDLIAEGRIGDVLAANLSVFTAGPAERPSARAWMGDRRAGANPLTIMAGHNSDMLCFLLGEFVEISARLATRIKSWRLSDTGETIKVDAPDLISFSGRLQSGAEATVNVIALAGASGGLRLTVVGSKANLTLTAEGTSNVGPNTLLLAAEGGPPEQLDVPDSYVLVPEGTPPGPAFNVAQAYVRYADSLGSVRSFDVDFDLAVRRHRLIAAIERSASEDRAMHLP